jgi:hypothetical protein
MVLPIFFLLMIRDTPLGEALFQTVIGWTLLGIFAVLQVGIYFLIPARCQDRGLTRGARGAIGAMRRCARTGRGAAARGKR